LRDVLPDGSGDAVPGPEMQGDDGVSHYDDMGETGASIIVSFFIVITVIGAMAIIRRIKPK